MSLKLGVVGATGVVGETFLRLLEERQFPLSEVRLFASDRSVGQSRRIKGRDWPVLALAADCFNGLDLVFFSSGDDISKEWAPKAVRAGAFAIDNSGAFRMDEKTPLIVPEVNPHHFPPRELPCVIANPNCSTIQLVVALHPLHQTFGVNQVRVATYQAVSGAGRAAQEELLAQLTSELASPKPGQSILSPVQFPHPIAFNCIPQIGAFGDDGFCSEERKIRLESRKILGLPHLKISAWTVRVPTLNSHCEVAWVTLDRSATRAEIMATLRAQPGLQVSENETADYPLARTASNRDPVFIGRVHQDPDDPRTWMLWIVADNLRKGAALNGLQIAEHLFP